MTAATMPMVYDKREWVARGGALFLGVVLATAIGKLTIHHQPVPADDPIRITLAEPPVDSPKPEPRIDPPKPIQQHELARPIQPKVATEPARDPVVTPVAASPSPAPEAHPVVVPTVPVAPVANTLPKVEETPVVQRNAAAEGRFAQDVRTQIERKKIYPDSARDLGMSGTVEVVYVLDRAGKLMKADIASSSGYPLLDQAALRAVRSAAFAPFPADAWVGESQKEFRTKLVFSVTY
jgi:protein TonB